jgi:hypothetical protein
MDWLLIICLGLIVLLALLVATLWFQLWLSRRDAESLRRITITTPPADAGPGIGCLGSLLGPLLLIVLALIFMAAIQ